MRLQAILVGLAEAAECRITTVIRKQEMPGEAGAMVITAFQEVFSQKMADKV
tara:strand:+ start:1253 stop:1408 length:156 start_codon:yes stop_codon:yes gene_type:complete